MKADSIRWHISDIRGNSLCEGGDDTEELRGLSDQLVLLESQMDLYLNNCLHEGE